MKADLHIHSTASDGSEAIEQIIDSAKKKGLDAIAITDHDSVSHIAKIPLSAGITIIGGIEISAIHLSTDTKAHILGYSIKRTELLKTLTRTITIARNRNSEKQIGILRRHGFSIDEERIARSDEKCIFKQHILDWLVSTWQVPDLFGEFYQRTFKNGGICDFDINYPDVFEAVRMIKKAGGLAVLAHPGQQQNFWLIPELVESGLDGLEVNHHSHSEKDKAKIREYAVRFGLFLTGGSDYHGRYEPRSIGIGGILSEESGVEAICQ